MAMLAAAIKTMVMIVSIRVELNAEKFMTISPVLTRIPDSKVKTSFRPHELHVTKEEAR